MPEEFDMIGPENKPEPKRSNENIDKDQSEQRWYDYYKSLPPYFSAIFAGINILVSLYFSNKLIDNSSRSAAAAEQSAANAEKSIAFAEMSARISNRAYVHAITAGIDTTTDKSPKIKVYIANNGQTPAYKVKTMGSFAIDTIECRNELVFENIKGVESVGIIPQKSHFWSIHSLEGNWKLSELKRALRGERFLHVYGWIAYETIFAERCSTTYSLCYDGKRKGFTVCPENNKDYSIKK